MASSVSFNLFFFFFISTLSLRIHGFLLPVARDLSSSQYVAEIRLGLSPEPIKLIVDLGGPSLWFDCSSSGHLSSSRRRISAISNHCAKASAHLAGADFRKNSPCYLLLRNAAVGSTARGELAEDILAVGSVAAVQKLVFGCAPPWLLHGLASGAQGVLGLGKAQISLPSQLGAITGRQRRLTVYLSPSNGVVSTDSAEEIFGSGVSRSLVYTPLVTNTGGNYAINVKSIRINGEKLPIEESLSAELSTVVPYMMMESSIYDMFVEAYAKAADPTKVKAVAPFRLCFLKTTPLPAVELGLQSEMVKWKIEGRNLMVDMGDGIGCLGVKVMDGGASPSPIVMGAHQLEGIVLDFDLGNSVIGFSHRGSILDNSMLAAAA